MAPMQAALEGARQIGFTVISISVSLIAAFIPVLFMGGVVGRDSARVLGDAGLRHRDLGRRVALRHADDLRPLPRSRRRRRPSLFDRIVEGTLGAMVSAYARTLAVALRNQARDAVSLLCAIVASRCISTCKIPKGMFPEDDTGLIIGITEASADISFEAMLKLQSRRWTSCSSRPGRRHVGSSVGGVAAPAPRSTRAACSST